MANRMSNCRQSCWCYTRTIYSFNQLTAVWNKKAFVFMPVFHMQMNLIIYLMRVSQKFLVCIPGKHRSMFNNLNLNGCLFILEVDLLKTSPHILILAQY